MRYVMAFLAGFIFVVVFGLCIQLAYIFLAMGYVELLKVAPWAGIFGGYVSYAVWGVVFFMLMAAGGVLTAHIARKHIFVICFLVGASTTALSAIALRDSGDYTWFSIFYIGLGILFTIIGGWYGRPTVD